MNKEESEVLTMCFNCKHYEQPLLIGNCKLVEKLVHRPVLVHNCPHFEVKQ